MTAPGTHRFAWDGFSIAVPLDWNLAHYRFTGGVSTARLEDDEAGRLQLEWVRPKRDLPSDVLAARFARQSEPLRRVARRQEPIESPPPGWAGTFFVMPDDRHMIVAYRAQRDPRFFLFLQMTAPPQGERRTLREWRALAESFALHTGPTVPWEVYDAAFELPRGWWLEETTFDAGRKRFMFQRRLRRLHIWRFSVASVILRDRTPAVFAVDFLNACQELRGRRFEVVDDHRLRGARPKQFPLVPANDLGRLCLRYTGACVHLPDQDALFLSLLNHRRQADLPPLLPHLNPQLFPW